MNYNPGMHFFKQMFMPEIRIHQNLIIEKVSTPNKTDMRLF
jgi:hypothetical protein